MSRSYIYWGLAALLAVPLFAQDPNAAPPQQNAEPDGQYEPGRAVARLSVTSGDVSMKRGDSGDVVAAAMNAPVMADDHVLTSGSSRAEVELDASNVLRIGPNSDVRFAALDTNSAQIQVGAGTVLFRTLRPSQAQVEVDTPSVAVRPLKPGAYRVTVHEDGTSEITVRSGEAEIDSQNGGEHLQAGQTMDARGDAADPEYQVVQGIARDSFDRWNEERDRYFQASQSYTRVSPAIAGGEDLDQNGQWVTDGQYGQVWQPSVGPDWAPYQNGRWTWEDYYGWTWVSYDPWGWAPYHYGRWFWGAGGWAWYPGSVAGYPYWAPAYVGFFGYGPGVGVGFGFGGVGWVALAPFETFHPWWGRGFYGGYRGGFYGGHTTVVNNFNVYNSYRNARVAGGAVGMRSDGFGRGGQIAALNRGQLQSAGAVRGVLPVSPERASLRFNDRAVSGRFPQSRTQSFAGRMQAPRVQHATFEQQQRGMEQISRGNFNRPATGSAGSSRGFGQATSPYASHGWSRFGEPIHNANGGAAPSQFGRSFGAAGAERPAYGGSAVRINPSIVSPRAVSPRGDQARPAPSYSAPRSFGGGRPAPAYGGGSRGAASAPRGSGGGGGGGHHR
ncbi:MAG TPA: DUF6600 domain-containing protein [Bryobacteraceae bacterium]|nr:DUF6600 domain-containing protein [Bryobacteraceae bacterium]